jgi:hypothetical protein
MFVIVRLDRTIQYSEVSVMESRTRGVLDTRRSLSSGAHSRDPVAGMTVVGGASSTSLREALATKQSSFSLPPVDCFACARNDDVEPFVAGSRP